MTSVPLQRNELHIPASPPPASQSLPDESPLRFHRRYWRPGAPRPEFSQSPPRPLPFFVAQPPPWWVSVGPFSALDSSKRCARPQSGIRFQLRPPAGLRVLRVRKAIVQQHPKLTSW